MLHAHGVSKAFTLHLQGGVSMPVLRDVDLAVHVGECVALAGPSGAGKSTLLRALYGNYRVASGAIRIRHEDGVVDIATASPREIVRVRAKTLGYVSQFLRVVPRVGAIDVVAQAARALSPEQARAEAGALLSRLDIPTRLHTVPPATFSGGEQQRVNLARGFIGGHPIVLLDEPTASLDAGNRDIVVAMIRAAKARGVAIVGIFHDTAVRDAVCDRLYTVSPLQDS